MAHSPAAVDSGFCAVNVARRFGCQKCGGVGNILGLGRKSDLRQGLRNLVWIDTQVSKEIGRYWTGEDGIGPDTTA